MTGAGVNPHQNSTGNPQVDSDRTRSRTQLIAWLDACPVALTAAARRGVLDWLTANSIRQRKK
jgi:hypothetical protein